MPMDSELDSLSYAMGVNIGRSLQVQEIENIDLDLFLLGIVDYQSNNSKMDLQQAGAFVNDFVVSKETQKNEQIVEDADQWMVDHLAKGGFEETPSGLQHKIVEQGNDKRPTRDDIVRLHFEGFLTSGQKFDSSVDRNQPIDYPVSQMIKGMEEGIQLIGEGGKITLAVPFDLAYGPSPGPGGMIPPYSNLVYEVELIEIITE